MPRLAFPLVLLAKLRLPACLCLLAFLSLACPSPSSTWPDDGDFDDHTFARLEDSADYRAHARVSATGAAALKFIIVGFDRAEGEHLRFLDSHFYDFHDEWYWFRLLNGHEVPGSQVRPVDGQSFSQVAEISEWFRARGRPILDLRLVDERLYSDKFYELSIHRASRRFGLGTLLYMPAYTPSDPDAASRPELWGFELEYTDEVETDALIHFFAVLHASLPDEIGSQLRFIARSPGQIELVNDLRAQDHPLADRLSSYTDLAITGEIQVYNPGLIAGRLRKLETATNESTARLTEGDPTAIWIMSSVPDELPAAAGLITAVPQTPLAHVNLLARNRGIPNLYLGGAMDDPQLDQLARVHAPVIVLAEADGTLSLQPISEQEYARWRVLRRPSTAQISPVELQALPYTIDLDAQPLAQMAELRRTAGGKAAGFVALRAAGVTMPDRPLAISVRAYAEHIAPLRPQLEDLLHDHSFEYEPRARYLLLEGRKDFDEHFPGANEQAWAESFVATHSPNRADKDAIAYFLARDGIKHALREQPLDPALAATLGTALESHFGHFDPKQGLRFRSSSSVEDLEGFSGAGLYDSNTGFLQPELQAKAKLHKRNFAWALRKTWASYWSWEAFEERELAGLDHLAGHMAVLVHARFDDELERSNGVLTLSYSRPLDHAQHAGSASLELDMEVDVQLGALSVTNPPPELAGKVLPEINRVTRKHAGAPILIERVAASTESAQPILSDALLEQLLIDADAVAQRWLEIEKLALTPGQARGRVTLDFEFRVVEPGWPALPSGQSPAPSRLVLKQVRSLDPGIPPGAQTLRSQPIPRELLLFADRVERRSCRGGRTKIELLELWTDPMHPELGHAQQPFLARIQVSAPAMGNSPPIRLDVDHLALRTVEHPGLAEGAPWALNLQFEPGVGLDRLEHRAGLLRLTADGKLLREEPAACSIEVMFASPDAFLRTLLNSKRRR